MYRLCIVYKFQLSLTTSLSLMSTFEDSIFAELVCDIHIFEAELFFALFAVQLYNVLNAEMCLVCFVLAGLSVVVCHGLRCC